VAIGVAYREAADLFELLDHVSAWWPDYVEPAVGDAWRARGLTAPGDSSWFARYARVRARYFDRRGQEGGGRAAGDAVPEAWRAGSGLFSAAATRTADPVAAAFHAADRVEAALAAIDTLVTREDRAFLQAFYARFTPRAAPLLAETRALTAASRAATALALTEPTVAAYLTRVATVVAGSGADSAAPVTASEADTPYTAVYVWWPDTAQTRATPAGRTLVLRVRPAAGDTVNSADVVAHEFIHAAAATMSAARQRDLSTRVLAGCTPPAGLRRLVLLEEPIATALGNIEFRRRFQPARFSWRRRWYGEPWVDVYARLLHPVLAERVETGVPLDTAFARDAAALCTALGRAVGHAASP
jgi:hypothetical protein